MNNVRSLKEVISDSNVISMDLKEIIKDCSISNTLINVCGLRRIGKTNSLINFAKENKHLVVVSNKTIVEQLRKQFDYYSIFSQDDLCGRFITSVVFDEGVDLDKLVEENYNREKAFKIVTGYINIPNCLLEDNKAFKQTIINNLEKEIKALGSKVSITREQGNASEYRNLIQAYRDIVSLYQSIIKE